MFKKIKTATLSILITTILKIILTFVSFYLATNFLGPKIIGAYTFYIAFINFSKNIVDSKGNKFLIVDDKYTTKQKVNTLISYELLIALSIFLISNCIIYFNDINNFKIFFILSLSLFTFPFFNILTAKNEKNINFLTNNKAETVGAFIFFLIISLSILYKNINLYLILPLAFCSKNIITSLLLFKNNTYKFSIEKNIIKDLFKFGLPLIISVLAVSYYWNIDDIIVGKFLTDTQLGYYWFAFYYPNYLLQIQNPFLKLLLPIFKNINDNSIKKILEYLINITGIICILIISILIILAPEIIVTFFGEEWLPALSSFRIYLVLIGIRATTIYWNEIFILKKETKFQMKISILNAILITLFGLCSILIFDLNILGMTLSVLITIIISGIIISIKIQKLLNINFLKILTKLIIYGLIFISIFYLNSILLENRIIAVLLSSLLYIMISTYLERSTLKNLYNFYKK